MNKSIHFSGQPTFTQLIKLLPKEVIIACIERRKSDYYYKKFNTWHHLVSMLFTCFGHCHSLREVVTGMRALEGRLYSCDIKFFPARSTFAEANAKRNSVVFEEIYWALKSYWDRFYPDSRTGKKSMYVIDSTTIKLFQAIFKGAGPSKQNGKRKGGLKVHMAVQTNQYVPSVIHLSPAACSDKTFNKYVNLPEGSTLIMDGGYRNYSQYNSWTREKIRWVTKLHPYTYYKRAGNNQVSQREKKAGVIKDQIIVMGAPVKKIPKVKCRLINFKCPNTKRSFKFITNDFKSTPSYISSLYKKRWGIELLFKRLKQNMPLQYFLGDNQNAIKIQVWCALIADLLLQVVRRQIKKKWSFSNIVSLIRLHLFNYLNLFSFLENPEKSIIRSSYDDIQLKLNLSG
jgi:Transposase DDE domain/Domain of unknown function (DUF4372)